MEVREMIMIGFCGDWENWGMFTDSPIEPECICEYSGGIKNRLICCTNGYKTAMS